MSFRLCRSVQFSSVTQSCPTLYNPMDCNMPGFSVHHQLLELAQTHVYRVGDAIQPSYPLSFPSPPAFSLSQHQGLFKWVSSLWLVFWSPYYKWKTEVQRLDPYQDLYQLTDDGLGFLHRHSSPTCCTYPHVPFLPFYSSSENALCLKNVMDCCSISCTALLGKGQIL